MLEINVKALRKLIGATIIAIGWILVDEYAILLRGVPINSLVFLVFIIIGGLIIGDW